MLLKKDIKAKEIAIGGLLVAMNLIVLIGTSLFPTMKLSLLFITALITVLMIVKSNVLMACMVYGITSIAGFLLIPEKSIWLLYLFFFGNYPIIKYELEKLRKPILEWLGKLLFLNMMLLALGYIGIKLMGLSIEIPYAYWIVYGMAQPFFVFYDWILTKIITWMAEKFKRFLDS